MAGKRQPIELVMAKGKKHLTKAEIEQRTNTEIKPISDEIVAPSYLTKTQQKEFYRLAEQLKKLKIMGETDVDTLARYIVSNDQYLYATKQLSTQEARTSPDVYEAWSRIQERYFKQVRACANDLGLTITSRCRLVVPAPKEAEKKENKFKKFEKD